jgi:hypothetical protein
MIKSPAKLLIIVTYADVSEVKTADSDDCRNVEIRCK